MKLKLHIAFLLIVMNVFSQKNNSNLTFSVNLLNETFGSGQNTTTSGISPAYCYNDQVSGTCFGNSLYLNDNQYVVTKAISPNNPVWFAFNDHSSAGLDLNGRFLAINIGSAAGSYGILYQEKIFNVVPNLPILVEAYLANLITPGFVGDDPGVIFEIRTSTGVLISQHSIPYIPKTGTWLLETVNLGAVSVGTPYLNFIIRSGSIMYNGNDLAMDDIRVYQNSSLKTNESVFNQVVVYPNPVSTTLNIDNVALDEAFVYDVFGHLIKTEKFGGGIKNVIDLKGITKGIYFINLQSAGISATRKIIVE